ncbi:hypothetical protein Taro_042934 [Colocasia esculenta]|uniref:Uncharacterized protein n=1 Tax=Colocasia esculenta TaxID=4460 RepID=A0A843WQU6_COLES|nr:hypothetical protein [Colocasia esculenta]
MGISVNTEVRTSREAPIQNRHFDPVAKELGITFRPGIEIAYVTTIRNRLSETVSRALVLQNSVLGPKFHPGACVKYADFLSFRGGLDPITGGLWLSDIAHHHLAIAILFLIAGHMYKTNLGIGHGLKDILEAHKGPFTGQGHKGLYEILTTSWHAQLSRTPTVVSFDRTGISVRTGVETAREAPIRNRHFDPVGKSSDSLDYANRWRSPHTEPACHGDQKSYSTHREISSPGRSYGCSNIADIVTL